MQIQPKCSYGRQVQLVCFNVQCKFTCFICNQNCKCVQQHEQCQKLNWNYINKKLNREIIKNEKNFIEYSNKIKERFQSILKYIQNEYDNYMIWKCEFGLTEKQKYFYDLFTSSKLNEIKGRQIQELKKQINKKSKLILNEQNEFNLNIQVIQSLLIGLGKQLNSLFRKCQVQKINKQQAIQKYQIVDQKNKNIVKQKQFYQLFGVNKEGYSLIKMINQGYIQNTISDINKKLHQNQSFVNKLNQNINLTQIMYQQNNHTILQVIKKISQNQKKMQKTQHKIEKFMYTIQDLSNSIKKNSIIQHYQQRIFSLENQHMVLSLMLSEAINKQNQLFTSDYKGILFTFNKNQGILLKKVQQLKPKLIKIKQKLTQQTIETDKNLMQTSDLNIYQKQIEQLEIRLSQNFQKNLEQIQKIKIQKLNPYFHNQQIQKLTLLYRASQNQFLVTKFHQLCDHIPHTITIIKTQFNKIIGGYTPIPWNKNLNNFSPDMKKQSFIFSISQNFVLRLNNSAYGIYSHPKYGPTFGNGCDICLYDKAHMNNNSYANIGNEYKNSLITCGNQQNYKRFSGQTNGYNFKVIQYEVYKIDFKTEFDPRNIILD